MKTKKLSLLKRILVVFCCTTLLSSSIFSAYSMTAYASETEWDDAAKACISIAGVICGLIFAPEITTGLVISALLDTAYNSITIGKYIYENSDGTYTIDESFVQAVMDAAEQLEAQGFTDSDAKRQGEGYLEMYKWTVSNTYMYAEPYQSTNSSHHDTYIRSSEVKGRVAGFNEIYSSTDSNGRSYTSYNHTVYNRSLNVVTGGGQGIFLTDGKVYQTSISGSNGDGMMIHDGTRKGDQYSGSSSFGGNFPIFSTYEAMSNYLYTGNGYRDAENYRAQPLFRRHSSYTPTYSGGSVTVSRTVVQNITQKIAEVDADDTKTDDEKIEALQRYILSGGTPDIGGGGSGGGYPGDKDYDDNKDLPAGTDLTDTNSWLKKIYLKVCQIFDKMNTAVEDAGSAAMARIQESLDEIIVQLKKIKRWTAVDTVIDGVDALADWLDLIKDVIKDAKEGAGSAVAAIAGTVGDSVDTMSKKFPFSVPWDILFFISVLSAEPQVPHFEIPFNIELSALDITIDYTMELDFEQLQWLSDLSRLLLSMTYAVGLFKMTAGITSVGKEG